jgi:D-alanyl-D-alanine carboxypeptidase/D-alanyl-D-alanine-endopeptidase (penicillin-binding protein 4)
MKNFNYLLSSLFFTSLAFGQIQTDSINNEFTQNLKAYGLSPKTNHAYCIQEGDGAIQGYQASKKQRIASITKLFTTLAAVNQFSLEKVYKTEFFYEDGKLHIKGGLDPYFEEEKIFFLISSLNKLGIKKLKSLTFDKNFLFTDSAPGEYQELTTAIITSKLKSYFNTASYSSTIKANLNRTKKFITEENLDFTLPSLSMSVSEVKLVDASPLTKLTPLIHTSRPLKSILKTMNVKSKNWIAHHLYNELNKIKSITLQFKELGLDTNTFEIKNGSGLPFKYSNGSRYDNLSSCETVIKMINKLKLIIENKGYTLQDIVAAGTDVGTFEKRFLNNSEIKEGILAKTGTLMHTSTLGGVLNAQNPIKFAILNHTESSANARKFQDQFLSDLISFTPQILALDYSRVSIFPLEDDAFFN